MIPVLPLCGTFQTHRPESVDDKAATRKGYCCTSNCQGHSTCRSGRAKNPFLPYDEQLWVQHLSDTHTLLLNKFNLVAHHVLVVTRAFESQDDRLNERDLSATWHVLKVR